MGPTSALLLWWEVVKFQYDINQSGFENTTLNSTIDARSISVIYSPLKFFMTSIVIVVVFKYKIQIAAVLWKCHITSSPSLFKKNNTITRCLSSRYPNSSVDGYFCYARTSTCKNHSFSRPTMITWIWRSNKEILQQFYWCNVRPWLHIKLYSKPLSNWSWCHVWPVDQRVASSNYSRVSRSILPLWLTV